ncbi:MAG: DUF1801 domain-containing protein [Paracoccaceae bacterium]|nr:DUF1801 domain-containing protein [Paracoccaceae bacterium]
MARKYASVDDYLSTRSPEVRPLLDDLRSFIHATMPGATEDLDYGVPVFLNAHGVPVLYLFGAKRHVNVGFLRSADLADPGGVLQGSGNPSKHVRVVPGSPVDEDLLAGFIHQCSGLKP